MNEVLIGRVNPVELSEETYPIYCKLYLIQEISNITPVTSIIEYSDISNVIELINPVLYESLNTETGKVLLLNEVYNLFMRIHDMELSREFLYQKINQLYEYHPSFYNKEVE